MPKTKITVHMVALVFLSLATPFVQASPGAAASSDLPDPCKMLSKAEFESILGNFHDGCQETMGSCVQINPYIDRPDYRSCTYLADNYPGPQTREEFTITTVNNDDTCEGKSCMKAWNIDKAVAGKVTAVAGVGDQAFFTELGGSGLHAGNGIRVLIGHLIVEIDMDGTQNSEGPDAAKNHRDQILAMARKVVAKVGAKPPQKQSSAPKV